MSRVYTDTIEPRKSTQDITLGTSGETISVGANSINVNTVADKGGNTLWTSDGSGNLSSVNSALKGNLVLLDTNTFTGASSSAFTTLIDSTYDVYIFKFINIQPTVDNRNFYWQGSTDGGSSYGVIATTTCFNAYHNEGDTDYGVTYQSTFDQAQSTSYMYFANTVGGGADECCAGELYLFSPSSTTYVKQFYTRAQWYGQGDYSVDEYHGGYFNTTSAINAIDFKMSADNMNGEIKMYGLL